MKMRFENYPDWSLYKLMFDIMIKLRSRVLIQWFLLHIISMIITTYFNVSFFSIITINVDRGLKYLFLMLVFENITSYCLLKQGLAKTTFVLDFLKHFHRKLNQRILSTDWIRIKLSDQMEVRQKLDEAANSVGDLVEQLIDQVKVISKFLMTILTILYICPIATIFIGMIYICFYRFYLNKQNASLLDLKEEMVEKNAKLFSKYWRMNENLFEYVIHHEKDRMIELKTQLKLDIRQRWHSLGYLYDKLSFNEDILGHLCTFIILILHYTLNGLNTFIIPLYHYLSTLTENIHRMHRAYVQWIRLKKDYDIVRPILEEYEQRINVEQIELKYQFQIEDLSFQYQGTREGFHLQYKGRLIFQMGETILITGKSGAGKSTFYDILNGIIPMKDYSARIQIDHHQQGSTTLHSIEKCRTMVLQDGNMDYRSTISSMITDVDEDQIQRQKTSDTDSTIWEILRLVQIDDFVQNELKSNLHEPIENKISGGQKRRLLLGRALYRAYHRNSSLLILDEPDQGLPAETTVNIIDNIIKWYRTKGILFLTLHTERAHGLDFDQILHIEQGTITKTK